jgi:hypothetical protein
MGHQAEHAVPESRDHINHVNAWIGEAAHGMSSDQLLTLSEMAMSALWKRAYLTLGDLTVAAITDRVLFTTAENFPSFELLKAGPTGIDWRELRKQQHVLKERELAEGVRFLIAEFMAVVGHLTADLLKPALHTELSKVKPEGPPTGGNAEGK